jgi:uncharacterized low-complexity protein
MPSLPGSLADKLSKLTARPLSRRKRLALAVGLPSALVLSVSGAAAVGALASTPSPSAAAGQHTSASGPSANGKTADGNTGSGNTGSGNTGSGNTGSGNTGSGNTGSGNTGSGKALPTVRQPRDRESRSTAAATSCTTVGHIGDSTSVGMISPDYLPDPAQRLAAQYADVGVRHLWVDASGGRSIVETLPGQVNGHNVARNWAADGFRGCWVFALGTNDTANVSVGSNVSRMARIEEMMAVAHGEPVMWVNTRTLLPAGPWSEANMQIWNNDLVAACAKYPNMRIFNWAAMDQPAWHISDGIHYTSAGYAVRAAAIAHALARAFPRNGHNGSCVVN